MIGAESDEKPPKATLRIYPEAHIPKIVALLDSNSAPIKIDGNLCFPGGMWCGAPIKDKAYILIHVALHLLNPEMDESWVETQTDDVYNVLMSDERERLESALRSLV